jgi:presenilin-like A22 family membrane protease
MDDRKRVALGLGIVAAIFLFVQLGALALVEPFDQVYDPVDDPQDPTNSIYYVVAILVATGVMLVAFKLGVDQFIRFLVVASGAWLSLYVFSVLVPPAPTVLGGFNVIALGAALAVGVALWAYPEWYVIDTAGALMGAAGAGLFGISFGILPALILLTVLAVYDAISVYGTEHMLTLASGVMDLKVPVVLVIPLSLSYSFFDAETPDPTAEADEVAEAADDTPTDEPGQTAVADGDGQAASDETEPKEDDAVEADPLDREALFIGLGDVVIPTVLVASAANFAASGTPAPLGIPLPALTAMVGSFVGLGLLMRMVLKGRAHAGLPLLNGGTIAGYLLGALASGLTLVDALGLGPYF